MQFFEYITHDRVGKAHADGQNIGAFYQGSFSFAAGETHVPSGFQG